MHLRDKIIHANAVVLSIAQNSLFLLDIKPFSNHDQRYQYVCHFLMRCTKTRDQSFTILRI